MFLDIFLFEYLLLFLLKIKTFGEMQEDNRLTFEEFEEKFWGYISKEIVSNRDIEDNRDWADMIVQEAWRVHVYSNTPYNTIMKTIEQVMFAYKRYKPVLI